MKENKLAVAGIFGAGDAPWLPSSTTQCTVLAEDECPEAWPASKPAPNAEYEHFHLVCRLRPHVLRPYVLMVEGGNSNAAPLLLVGRLEEQVLRGKIGYLRLGCLKVRTWVGVHDGWLGDGNSAQTAAALEHIARLLDSGDADMAVFHGVRQDAALWEVLPRVASARVWRYATSWTPRYGLRLQSDPEFLWKRLRSKHRSWLRTCERQLKERFGDLLLWRWYREFPDLDDLLRRLEQAASRTYQRALGAGFRDDVEHRERFKLFAQQRILRVLTLETEGRILAFRIGLLAHGTCYTAGTGCDPDVACFRPGTLALFKAVENLVREGARFIDFGLGHADYKQRFADDHYLERDLYLFARSFRGLLATLLFSGLRRLDDGLRHFLGRLGWINRIKTRWR